MVFVKSLLFLFGILYLSLVQGGPLFTPQAFKFEMFFGNCGSFGSYFSPSPILRCQCGFFMSFCNKEILIPEKGPLMRSENNSSSTPIPPLNSTKNILEKVQGTSGTGLHTGLPVLVPGSDQPVGSIEVKNEDGVRVLPVINNLAGQKPKEIKPEPKAPKAEIVQEKKISQKPQKVEEKEPAESAGKKENNEPGPALDESGGKAEESK